MVRTLALFYNFCIPWSICPPPQFDLVLTKITLAALSNSAPLIYLSLAN